MVTGGAAPGGGGWRSMAFLWSKVAPAAVGSGRWRLRWSVTSDRVGVLVTVRAGVGGTWLQKGGPGAAVKQPHCGLKVTGSVLRNGFFPCRNKYVYINPFPYPACRSFMYWVCSCQCEEFLHCLFYLIWNMIIDIYSARLGNLPMLCFSLSMINDLHFEPSLDGIEDQL